MRKLPTTRSRYARADGRKLSWLPLAAVLVVGTLAAAFVVPGALRGRTVSAQQAPSVTTGVAKVQASALATSGAAEVPEVVGNSLSDARLVLGAAGFSVRVEGPAGGALLVETQSPSAGTVSDQGTTVILRASSQSTSAPEAGAPRRWTVCIDPGHQQFSDSSPEPIGPGSKQTKPAASGGTTGIRTGIPEYELALQISTNLKRRLEDAGVRVVMTRTTNDVLLSNAERAKLANNAKADLFVRVHGTGDPDASLSGIGIIVPANNAWTKSIAAPSRRAADEVRQSVLSSTGAVDRGVVARADQAGFNYSAVPAILVEAGYLSNPVEDRLLASPHYQDKVAEGIADGVLRYLSAKQETK